MQHVQMSRASLIAGLMLAVGAAGATGCMTGDPADADPAAGDDPATATAESELNGTDMINALNFVMSTGSDDKRSDSHVFVQVTLTDGRQFTQEAGLGQTWPNNTTHTEPVTLPIGTLNSQIQGVSVFWKHGGGAINADNWNLQQLQIQALDATLDIFSTQVSLAGNPLVRFNSHTTSFSPTYNH